MFFNKLPPFISNRRRRSKTANIFTRIYAYATLARPLGYALRRLERSIDPPRAGEAVYSWASELERTTHIRAQRKIYVLQ